MCEPWALLYVPVAAKVKLGIGREGFRVIRAVGAHHTASHKVERGGTGVGRTACHYERAANVKAPEVVGCNYVKFMASFMGRCKLKRVPVVEEGAEAPGPGVADPAGESAFLLLDHEVEAECAAISLQGACLKGIISGVHVHEAANILQLVVELFVVNFCRHRHHLVPEAVVVCK